MIGSVSADADPVAERQARAHERERGRGADDALTIVTSTATDSVVFSASWIWKSLNAARYQCSVQPVIGNVPYWFALKLNSTSRMIGANRKT